MRGTIVKALAGFYDVYADGTVYECRARGVFRKGSLSPLVGDEVEMTVEVGDKVITGKYSGTQVKVDGVEYTIVRQNDILAVVED